METLAHAFGHGRPDKTTPSSPCRAPQLGGLEKPERGSINVQDDSDTHRSRGIWGIPVTDWTRKDIYLSPLQTRGRHGATHASVLPGMGRASTNFTNGDRSKYNPGSAGESNPRGSSWSLSRPCLLRSSNAGKGMGGKGKGEDWRPGEDR
jgi:hypothetical protein